MPTFVYIIAIVLLFFLSAGWKWRSKDRIKAILQDPSEVSHEKTNFPEEYTSADIKPCPTEGLHSLDIMVSRETETGEDVSHADFNSRFLRATALLQQKSYREAEETLLALLDEGHQYNDIYVMAEARYQLAHLSKLTHDLTSACENWHMAKERFMQLTQQKEYDPVMRGAVSERIKDIEKIMREHGCPTEWVLTDF